MEAWRRLISYWRSSDAIYVPMAFYYFVGMFLCMFLCMWCCNCLLSESLGGAHVKCQPRCFWVCKRRVRSSRRTRPKASAKMRWKRRIITLLLLQHDLHLVGATVANLSHTALATQSSFDDGDVVSSALMQLPGVREDMNPGSVGFPHLRDDMVKQHFIQWEEPITTVFRKRGFQFRCASEYIYQKRMRSVDWTGWCEPTPPIKLFNGEATLLASNIIRRSETRDVALDIQIRKGSPAYVEYHASVLRMKTRVTRHEFVRHVSLHMRFDLHLAGDVEHVFYKGRIWPETSTFDIKAQHCDTFVVMCHEASDSRINSTVAVDDGERCALGSTAMAAGAQDPAASAEQSEEKSPDLGSEDSYDVHDFNIFTYLVGTESGVKRYDTVLRRDSNNVENLELLAMFLRCEVIAQEIAGMPGLAVEDQRIFLVLHEDNRLDHITLQRRFRGFENEELRLATVRGDINYDRYARSFLQDNPLEVFLGPDIWTSSPYRVLRAGSVVTALYPDPAGGAYRFERDLPGVSLLQRRVFLKRSALGFSSQAPGNAEEAPWDLTLDCPSSLHVTSPWIDFFQRLSPPGNPDVLHDSVSVQSERSSIDRIVDEAQLLDPGNSETCWISDAEGEEPRNQSYSPFAVEVPERLHECLRLLVPWIQQPLCLDIPEDCKILPIVAQFLHQCEDGWSEEIESVHVYTDGSSKRIDDEHRASFAFAAFGFKKGQPPNHFFLGWFARKVILDHTDPVFTGASACDARESETSALVWANIWTLQSGIRLPVHFHFDAISVGLAMTGSWNLRPDWLQGRKLREIVLFSQHLRVGCLHHYEHCKAHALQPCNELCDALAKMVCDSSSTLTSIVKPGLQWNMLFQDDDVRLSWAWWNVTYFTGHEYPPQKDDGLSISSSAGHHDVSCPTHLTERLQRCAKDTEPNKRDQYKSDAVVGTERCRL